MTKLIWHVRRLGESHDCDNWAQTSRGSRELLQWQRKGRPGIASDSTTQSSPMGRLTTTAEALYVATHPKRIDSMARGNASNEDGEHRMSKTFKSRALATRTYNLSQAAGRCSLEGSWINFGSLFLGEISIVYLCSLLGG